VVVEAVAPLYWPSLSSELLGVAAGNIAFVGKLNRDKFPIVELSSYGEEEW